jgi:hypothetical protein
MPEPAADEEHDGALVEWGFVEGARRRRASGRGRTARDALQLVVRELRLVLALLFVLFVTGEAWQFFGRAEGARFVLLLGIFAGLAIVVGAIVARRETRTAIARVEPGRAVPARARRTLKRRLRRRTWFETLVAAAAVSAFFFLLGIVAVDATLTQEWSSRDDGQMFRLLPLSELWQGRVNGHVELYRLWGGGWVVSEPLLRISILLGAFAGLLFAAEVLTDRDLRADVIDDLLDEWHATLSAWQAQR